MKYLKIKNKGLMEPQALTLMGASTKAGDDSKIGMFGSGNKYALAYLIRNNINIKIYTGEDEITLSTVQETFREEQFNILLVNGEKTSITSAMGKDWVLWQALREIYCNALDEGDATIDTVDTISPIADETHFYIEVTPAIKEFLNDFDKYFTSKKTLVYENEIGRIYRKHGKHVNIYRKGIRCSDIEYNSTFDYDFNSMPINESRVVSNSWSIPEQLFLLMVTCTDQKLIKQMLVAGSYDDYIEEFHSSAASLYTSRASQEFKDLIATLKLAPKEMGGLCTPEEQRTFLFIRNKVYKAVEQFMDENNKADTFRYKAKGSHYKPITPTPLQQAILDRAEEFFNAAGYTINYPVKVVSFVNKDLLGMAVNDEIYISDIALEKGVHDTCNTLIEEMIHLKYECEDETRKFQNAAINELLTYMKQKSAFAM